MNEKVELILAFKELKFLWLVRPPATLTLFDSMIKPIVN